MNGTAADGPLLRRETSGQPGAGGEIRILLLADTHLGLDAPLRPRVERRRRGDDFYANYLAALQPALDGQADLVVHGGDMFFRSRVHPAIVESAFAPLLQIADLGVPICIVPGNHERGNLPRSLLESHARIHIFDHARTFLFTLRGRRLALAGFPNLRENARDRFAGEVEKTEWMSCQADLGLLCMHQAVEGAQVGVQNYTFRGGEDVIRGRDIPAGFQAVLSGHIHRYQVLTRDLAGRRLNAPVFYPGSIERTSFAEREEQKGFLIIELAAEGGVRHRFMPLPARPMVDLDLTGWGSDAGLVGERLLREFAQLDENAIVRIHSADPAAGALMGALNDRWLRSAAPKTMNIGWSYSSRASGDSPGEASSQPF